MWDEDFEFLGTPEPKRKIKKVVNALNKVTHLIVKYGASLAS
jgi:hypothetical protein